MKVFRRCIGRRFFYLWVYFLDPEYLAFQETLKNPNKDLQEQGKQDDGLEDFNL